MVKTGLNARKNLSANAGAMTAQTLLQWIDLLWIPAGFIAAERGKRLFTAAFAGACVLLLRLQVELLHGIGFSNGFMGFMTSPVLYRGMFVYGFFILLLLVLAFYSKGSDKNIHIAASITLMIAAFCVSTFIMVL